jgi:ABC-type anion transport system duplicated permease subunit
MRRAFWLYGLATAHALASIPAPNGFPLLLAAGVAFVFATVVYEEAKER